MKVTTVRTPEEFAALRDEYVALRAAGMQQRPGSTVLSAHRWLMEWWRAYAGGFQVRVFCAYDEGRLVAALPVMFGATTLGGVKLQQASFLGSHWGGFDLPPRAHNTWLDAFVDWLRGPDVPRWQLAKLGPLLTAAADDLGVSAALTRHGLRFKKIENPKPFLAIGDSWQAFLATKSRNFRRTIKRKEQKMQADGGFEVSHIRSPTAQDLDDTVVKLSTASWQGHQGFAVASTPAGRAFYQKISADSTEFTVELCVLRRAGNCIAYLLGAIQDDTYHALDTAFDPSFAEHSPGLVVHFEVLSKLGAQGVTNFEFGYDSAYKSRFDPEYRSFCDILVYRNAMIFGLARGVENAKRVRAWYQSRRKAEEPAAPPDAEAANE